MNHSEEHTIQIAALWNAYLIGSCPRSHYAPAVEPKTGATYECVGRRGKAIAIPISIPLPIPNQYQWPYQCQQVSARPAPLSFEDLGDVKRCVVERSRYDLEFRATQPPAELDSHSQFFSESDGMVLDGIESNRMGYDAGILWRLNHCYLEPLATTLWLLVFSISGNFDDNSGSF